MSSGADEPPGLSEESLGDQDKSELLSYKDIMMKNKFDLKKKEEAVQAYANKLSKIKSRTKLSRRSAESSSSSTSLDASSTVKHEASLPSLDEDDDVNDISEAKTPKAKSHLLQKKLAENRKIFEQRNKEINESNRAVEEKVEAIRQKINETELQKEQIILPITPISLLPQISTSADSHELREKDNKITELSMKIQELETIIIDLQDNLKEKDSVIDSKTKAVTLMSEDLSKRGKTTLDTLEETKDEMRVMQENFVLMERSFRDKHEHLLGQLEERSNRVVELEDSLQRIENEASTTSADSPDQSLAPDSGMLMEMRREMSSMQENFVLIESSLKDKINHLILQLEERERRLAEIENNSSSLDLLEKLNKLEESNRLLEEDNQKLSKTIDNFRTKYEISANEFILEKDNKIAELERIIEERASIEEVKESEAVRKLTLELEELNKTMIKLKAQHKSKLRNLNKRLESFKMVSDANAELVKLGNQVALLEEEKGNLQLSLVDFDEIKVSSGELQRRVDELEMRIGAQAEEISTKLEAIAALENQKFELMQELHSAKQEISSLEAENADCENLRVTAELKVVELEEQLESVNRQNAGRAQNEARENAMLIEKQVQKLDEKSTVDSFESIEENRNELLKQVDLLTQKNQDLEMQLREFRDKGPSVEKKSSETDSTESFERISDNNDEFTKKMTNSVEKLSETSENTMELHQRIENLVQENSDLVIELTKIQEKYERSSSKIQELTEENGKLLALEKLQLRETSTVLPDGETLASLEAEIANCRELTERQVELIENLEMNLLGSRQEADAKREEIAECQLLIKNFTIIQSHHAELDGIIGALKREKLQFAEELKNLEGINADLVEKLKEKGRECGEIEGLSEELASLRKLVIEKARSLDDAQSGNEELKIKLDSVEQENAELKRELDRKNDSIGVLEEEFRVTVGIIEDKLKDKELILISLESQVPSLQESLNEKEEIISELREKVERLEGGARERELGVKELESKLEAVEGLLDEKERTLVELRGNVTLLEEESQATTSLIADLQGKLREKEEAVKSLQAKLEALQSVMAEKENATAALREVESSCQSSLIEQENLRQSTSTELADETRRLQELQAKNIELEENLSDLQSELRNKSSIIDELKEEIANTIRIKNTLEEEAEELKSSKLLVQENYEELRNDLSEIKEELRGLSGENDSLKEDKSELTSRLEGVEKELGLMNNQSRIDRQTIDELSRELENRKIEINNKELSIIELTEEIERMKDLIIEKENMIMALEAAKTELFERMEFQIGKMNVEMEEVHAKTDGLQRSIAEKEEILKDLIQEKENLLKEIEVRTLEQKESLSTIENQRKYGDELRIELNEAYRMMELLKEKHTEDTDMQNQRLELLVQDLQNKTAECSHLSLILQEKDKIIGENVTSEVKANLEERIVLLQNELEIMNNNSQAQLQKMKVIAANLKKKTAQCQELESRANEFSEKWNFEKQEKEEIEVSSSQAIQRLSEELNAANEKIVELHDAVKVLQLEIAEKSEEISSEKSASGEIIRELRADKELALGTVEKLNTELTECRATLSEIEAAMVDLQREIVRKNEIISEFESFKEVTLLDQQAARESIEKLKFQMMSAEEITREFREQFEISAGELNTKYEEIEALKGELEDKNQQIHSITLGLRARDEEVRALTLELDEKIDELEQTKSELRGKLEELRLLNSSISEKNEEFDRAKAEVLHKSEELQSLIGEHDNEKLSKEAIIQELESFKANSSSEKSTLVQELEEAKEKARELGVRMQVMETEYVEQLNTIQTLRTENGMLSSKHAQTNERLENTETESNERLRNIEALKNEIIELKNSGNQTAASCDHCERCQSLVNALEGKLQERNAEIENLDNELANSIANFLQMRENLRTQELQCNEESQEARNTLAQYNELLNKNAEYEVKIEELSQRIIQLNERNDALDQDLARTEESHRDLSRAIQMKETELEEMRARYQELEMEKSEISVKLENAPEGVDEAPKLEDDDVGIPVHISEGMPAPKLFDATKLFTHGTPAPWDIEEPSDGVSVLTEQLDTNEIERSQLSSRLAELSSRVSEYREEIRVLNLRNEELLAAKASAESELREKISDEDSLKMKLEEQADRLLNHEEEIRQLRLNNEELKEHVAEMNDVKLSLQNYEKQVQIIIEERDEVIGNLKREKENYVGAINRFMAAVEGKIPGSSIDGAQSGTLDSIVLQLDAILGGIDALQQRVSIPQRAENIVDEAVKEDKSVELSGAPRWNEEIKLDEDEDVWGWNAQDAELGSAVALAPFCTGETQLKARIAELEDTIRDFEDEKLKLNEELKVGQIRSGKLVKKLKEFKIQNESLKKQLKLQMSSGNLCDLDSAIEDELKLQIGVLEKSLAEIKADNEKINIERDNLLKRIDVLTAANERFIEMKERQDREVEVLQIHSRELQNKIEFIEREVGQKFTPTEACESEKKIIEESSTERYDELRESLDLLAAENEELRELIESERSKRLAIELTLTERMREIEETKNQTDEMKINFDETLKKCQNLEKECVDNLDAANQRTIEVENNHEIVLGQALLRTQELEGRIAERDERIRVLEESLEASQRHLNEAQDTLANVTELLNVRVQEVAELRQQIQQMQLIKSEAESCQIDVENLTKKLIETEEGMSRQLSQKDQEIESLSLNLREELREKMNEISRLSMEGQELASTVELQKQELEALRESVDKNEWLVEAMRTEANADKKTISSLELSLATLGKAMEDKSTELSQRDQDLQSLREVLSSVERRLEEPNCPSCPVCKANETILQDIDNLKAQLSSKDEELEDLKYILNENTYPRMLQELQDRVNQLYNEKSQLESSLASALEELHAVGDVSIGQEAIVLDETADKIHKLEKSLEMKEQEAEVLRKKLDSKVTECILLENALGKQLPGKGTPVDEESPDDQQTLRELTSNELDVALYMLHQRDVRCEELTHELMQLLEERDTLQLRLSNAIRLNEELRRIVPGELNAPHQPQAPEGGEKVLAATSDGSADKMELAQKLSQLHTVGHRRDVRLMDDSELRNTQQMSLLAHKDALSTLPPDAAARLINANYTLSRDVQSQSSVLLNWLWGKSTPKVVHM